MAGFAPAPAVSTSPVVRQGSKLIIPVPPPGQAAVLPPLCVKCGAPGDGKTVKKTFYWHHPALYVLILSPIIYVIVALIVRKSIKVNVPLCAQHAQRRSIAVTLAWVLPLIGFADIFILGQLKIDSGIIALVTMGLIVAGIVIWAVVASPIRPTMIDATRGEFTGACAAFLEHVPETALPGPPVPQPAVPPPPVQ